MAGNALDLVASMANAGGERVSDVGERIIDRMQRFLCDLEATEATEDKFLVHGFNARHCRTEGPVSYRDAMTLVKNFGRYGFTHITVAKVIAEVRP